MKFTRTTLRIGATVAITVALLGAAALGLAKGSGRKDNPTTPVLAVAPAFLKSLGPGSVIEAGNGSETSNRGRQRNGKEIPWEQEQNHRFNGVISGHVWLSNGKPAQGFKVDARFVEPQTLAPGEGSAVTDASGYYEIYGLSPESFRVYAVSDGADYIAPTARIVPLNTFPDATATNVDFTLTRGLQITVRVRDAQSGASIPGIEVRANQTQHGSPSLQGVTDARGELRFRASQLETRLQLEAGKRDGYFISPAPGSAFYRLVKFLSADRIKDVVWDVKTYTQDPKQWETVFRGVVTDEEDQPVWGATVRMVRGSQITSTKTGPDGAFSLPTHRMQETEYGNWDGVQRRGILIEAEKGKLRAKHYATPEETWSRIPVKLKQEEEAGTSVTGQVVGTDGRPLAGVPIHYSEVILDAQAYSAKNAGASDTNGRFTIRGLSPEAFYQFCFGKPAQIGNDCGFGVTKVPEVEYTTGQYRLKPGEQRNLGRVVVLRSDTSLAGRLVTPEGGIPTGRLMVVIEGKHMRASAMMEPDGKFTFPHVVRETLTLAVFSPNNDEGRSYSTGPDSPTVAERRTVQGGVDTNITVTLRK